MLRSGVGPPHTTPHGVSELMHSGVAVRVASLVCSPVRRGVLDAVVVAPYQGGVDRGSQARLRAKASICSILLLGLGLAL
eukprot:scaffold115661_cov34-Tisochrysis_lutea.AAC.1